MKAIVCEMCGSQDLIKQDGYYVCQNCGTKYDPEEAKKLMVEVSGAVKVDNTEILQNYYRLARRAAADNNARDAAKYYDLIRQEDANSWEAQYYAVYYSIVSHTTVGEIAAAADLLQNTTLTVFSMIEANATPDDASSRIEAAKSLELVANDSRKLFINMFQSAKSNVLYFLSDDAVLHSFFFDNTIKLCMAFRNTAGGLLKYSIIDYDRLYPIYIKQLKADNKMLADGWNIYVENSKAANEKTLSIVEDMLDLNFKQIKKADDSYSKPKLKFPKLKGCYVATAIYGSYDCPQVWTLRRYRDYTLAESWYGRAFIHTYYAISPTLVKWFGDTQWFRNMWKPKLDKMVERLNRDGVADTPYQDRQW